MKKKKNLFVALMLAFAVLVSNFAIAPATTYAAGKPEMYAGIAIMQGGKTAVKVLNTVKSDKIIKVKSSNSKILTAKSVYMLGQHRIQFTAKKAGEATVSFTVKRKNGKTYSLKSHVIVHKYTNPFNKINIGKKSYKKQFNKKYDVYNTSYVKGKLNISLKPGFKLRKIYYYDAAAQKMKTIKNGKKIVMDKKHRILIEYTDDTNFYNTAMLGGIK